MCDLKGKTAIAGEMNRFEINVQLNKIAEGNEKAFENLYNGIKGGVYSFAYSYMKNREDAEDIVQTVFLKIKKNIDKFDGKNGLPWILQITKNTALGELRSRKVYDNFVELNLGKDEAVSIDENDFDSPVTSAKDGKQTDEIVTATKKYFREKGVYSVVLKETVSVNSLAEKTGLSVSGERDFKSAAKNLPELYGERNVTDMEQAYDDYIVSGLYNLVKNKISNIVNGAALILRMKVVNFEIKLCTGGKDYWNAGNSLFARDLVEKMENLIAGYAEITGGKHVIKSAWDLDNVIFDYCELFGGISKETDLDEYLQKTTEYLDSLTTDIVKSNESKFVAVLDKTDLDTMGYETLTRVPQSISEYRRDLCKVLSGLFVSREKEYKETYEKQRTPVSEEEYDKYYDKIIGNYGSLENFWKKIK